MRRRRRRMKGGRRTAGRGVKEGKEQVSSLFYR